MELFRNLFSSGPRIPTESRQEVNELIEELIKIGKQDDYLSERPGGLFNGQYRHIRARAIGNRLNAIGGLPLMQYAHDRVRKKLGLSLVSHLEYAWTDIGEWVP